MRGLNIKWLIRPDKLFDMRVVLHVPTWPVCLSAQPSIFYREKQEGSWNKTNHCFTLSLYCPVLGCVRYSQFQPTNLYSLTILWKDILSNLWPKSILVEVVVVSFCAAVRCLGLSSEGTVTSTGQLPAPRMKWHIKVHDPCWLFLLHTLVPCYLIYFCIYQSVYPYAEHVIFLSIS